MDDTRAYIDLVFRNGLKDYEETPPPEVWEDVKIIIDKKIKRFMFFMRSAASIAVIVSISILANMLRQGTTTDNVAVINSNESVPVDIIIPIPPAIVQDRTETTIVTNKTVIAPVTLVANNREITDVTSIENYDVDVSESLVAETETLPEVKETLNIDYDNIFAGYQPLFYNDIYGNAVNDEDSRWSIMAMASPLYQSQFVTSENELSRQVANSDQATASYSGGVGLAFKINNRFSVQSGLYYSAMGQQIGGIEAKSGFKNINAAKATDSFKVLTRSGTIVVNNPDILLASNDIPNRVITPYTSDIVKNSTTYLSDEIFTDLKYLELPFMLRYKAIDRKMGISLVGGLSYNFVVSNSMYAVTDNGRISLGDKMEGVSNVALSSSLGMGMEYKISHNFSFNVEPTFKYFMNTPNSSRIAGLHTYSFGVFSGLSYKF